MHRQSLGSPGSSSSSSNYSLSTPPPHPESDDSGKTTRNSVQKRSRGSIISGAAGTDPTNTAYTIHFIPALTLFCFLLLYLLSHDPSPTDMEAAFGRPGGAGAGGSAFRAVSAEVSGHRGLKQTQRPQKLVPHAAGSGGGVGGGGRSSRKLRGGGGGGGHRRQM